MDAVRMADLARRLEALDPDLYDGVLEIIAESRRMAVEEYIRDRDKAAPERSPHDKRKVIL